MSHIDRFDFGIMSKLPAALKIDASDLEALRAMKLLRPDVAVNTDVIDIETFGVIYDSNQNLAEETLEMRAALQQRCRDFARYRGFALRVESNNWHKATQEGNAKYVCKQLHGQQSLSSGMETKCPFFINVYGKQQK